MKSKIIAFALCIFFGCSLFQEDDEIEYIEAVVGVDSIHINNISNMTVWFAVFCTVGDPCWEFWKHDESKIGSDIYVKVYARRDRSLVCLDVIGLIKVPLIINVGSAGDYYFHFWQTDTSSLDTTISIQ